MATTKSSKPAVKRPAAATKAPTKSGAQKSAAAVKPATKRATPATSALKAKASPKAAVAGRKRNAGASVSPEQRRNYVEIAAYYIAERRGFAPGDPLQDWIEAEAEIDRLLAGGRLGG